MKTKLKKILIPFIFIFVFYIAGMTLDYYLDFGVWNPHVGILYIAGLLFGPYGALGAVSANILLDFANGYTPLEIFPSAIISFGVSCLAYKLWYSGFRGHKLVKPRLDNTYHLFLFFTTLLICGVAYSISHGILFHIFFTYELEEFVITHYFLNFINIAFVFGIITIWLSKRIDFVDAPKVSKRRYNKIFYQTILLLLIIILILSLITSLMHLSKTILICETALITILLYIYLTKPNNHEVYDSKEITILEKIMNVFLTTTLAICLFGIVLSICGYTHLIVNLDFINEYLPTMPFIVVTDILIVLFFIPGIIILRYVEKKVTQPISSFSQIEKFIKENEKIEAEGLINIYSNYINEENEIGTLARSYTNLITHNNNYIENIREIEGEKERIKAELDIARKIQSANLPTEAIEDDEFIVNGYSKPAKEVGGDFFDYYMLDEDNLAIVIGDVSGKGVPAAILAMISQVMMKHILNEERDPSKALYLLNNELCDKNSETMFLTLWLGIYNEKNKVLTFSNAGHNPPLIKENGAFKYMDIDSGLVLGIMEDFEYEKEEIKVGDELVIFTDGITDANNKDYEMYGEDRLLSFFNGYESDEDPIRPLLNDIHDFTKEQEQFDDMTLVYLKAKHD